MGFANLYLDKTAITAAEFKNDKDLLFFDIETMRLIRVLKDRGLEYPTVSGKLSRKIKNQIIQEEFYSVKFRKTLTATSSKYKSFWTSLRRATMKKDLIR